MKTNPELLIIARVVVFLVCKPRVTIPKVASIEFSLACSSDEGPGTMVVSVVAATSVLLRGTYVYTGSRQEEVHVYVMEGDCNWDILISKSRYLISANAY